MELVVWEWLREGVDVVGGGRVVNGGLDEVRSGKMERGDMGIGVVGC